MAYQKSPVTVAAAMPRAGPPMTVAVPELFINAAPGDKQLVRGGCTGRSRSAVRGQPRVYPDVPPNTAIEPMQRQNAQQRRGEARRTSAVAERPVTAAWRTGHVTDATDPTADEPNGSPQPQICRRPSTASHPSPCERPATPGQIPLLCFLSSARPLTQVTRGPAPRHELTSRPRYGRLRSRIISLLLTSSFRYRRPKPPGTREQRSTRNS